MRTLTLRFTIASALATAVLGLGAGTADAATSSPDRVGRDSSSTTTTSTRLDIRRPAEPPRSVCSDWTNEDGTHGTSCGGGSDDWIEVGSDSNPPTEGADDG